MLSPTAKRKMIMPPDLIGYIKGKQKSSFVEVLDRINNCTQKLTDVNQNRRKAKYQHPIPGLLVERYSRLNRSVMNHSSMDKGLKPLAHLPGKVNRSSFQIKLPKAKVENTNEESDSNLQRENYEESNREPTQSYHSKQRSVFFDEKSLSLAGMSELPPITGKKPSLLLN